MQGYKITLTDDSIVKLCAENIPVKCGTNSILVDSHKITFEVSIRGIDEDEDMMCE